MQVQCWVFLLKVGPIAHNSLGTLSAISQAILAGMLSFFHRVYIGTSSFDENTVLGHCWQEKCGFRPVESQPIDAIDKQNL